MSKSDATSRVYYLSYVGKGVPRNRPFISEDGWPEGYDWVLTRIARGEISAKKYQPMKLTTGTPHPQATDYDFYGRGVGLLSARAREVIEPFAAGYFTFLDASLYGKPYYFLRIKKALEGVLDVGRSDIDEYGGVIEYVGRPVFFMDRIPESAFFCILENSTGPFATEPVAKAIKKAKLKGMALEECG